MTTSAQSTAGEHATVESMARAAMASQLHLTLDGASYTEEVSTLGVLRAARAEGGRFPYFAGAAAFGTLDGPASRRVRVAHFFSGRDAGTYGAVIVLDARGHAVIAGWELFSPD